jgi:hypothetical protein
MSACTLSFRIFPRPPVDAHPRYALVDAQMDCYYCGQPFGFNVPIYRDPLRDNELTAHLSCAIEHGEVRVWTPEHFAASWPQSQSGGKRHHPEQRDGEIYMGNTMKHDFMLCAWMSKRLGETALDVSGNAIPKSPESYGYGRLLPMFIQRSEIEQTIATEKLLNRPWSAEKIRDLMPLLAEDWMHPEPEVQP